MQSTMKSNTFTRVTTEQHTIFRNMHTNTHTYLMPILGRHTRAMPDEILLTMAVFFSPSTMHFKWSWLRIYQTRCIPMWAVVHVAISSGL